MCQAQFWALGADQWVKHKFYLGLNSAYATDLPWLIYLAIFFHIRKRGSSIKLFHGFFSSSKRNNPAMLWLPCLLGLDTAHIIPIQEFRMLSIPIPPNRWPLRRPLPPSLGPPSPHLFPVPSGTGRSIITCGCHPYVVTASLPWYSAETEWVRRPGRQRSA